MISPETVTWSPASRVGDSRPPLEAGNLFGTRLQPAQNQLVIWLRMQLTTTEDAAKFSLKS